VQVVVGNSKLVCVAIHSCGLSPPSCRHRDNSMYDQACSHLNVSLVLIAQCTKAPTNITNCSSSLRVDLPQPSARRRDSSFSQNAVFHVIETSR